MRRITVVILALVVVGNARVASAQESNDPDVSWAKDGAITGVALAGTLLLMLVPVDTDDRWQGELLGDLDRSLRGRFSSQAAVVSDGLVATTILAPLVLLAHDGFDEAAGRQALLYGETLGVSLLAMSVAKYAVQRPRPYVYSSDSRIKAYADDQGKDAHLSFYSGHASLSFSAAVAGSTLFASETESENARAWVWGVEMGLATTTSLLRVRAGKHFYSDIAVGALAGAAIGVLVPALHTGSVYKPSSRDWGAMAAGVGLGVVMSKILPLDDHVSVPLTKDTVLRDLQLAPMATEQGGGLSLAASF